MRYQTDNSGVSSAEASDGGCPGTRRVHLGASRLENFDDERRAIFVDPSWTHLGDPAPSRILRHNWRHYLRVVRELSVPGTFGHLSNRLVTWRRRANLTMAIHNGTKFFEWTYAKGDRLPFESSSLAFVYSEHFLEHLFLDEALSLLKECHRVLGPGGVIRTVVPDADLRTYAKPEPVGYPSLDVAYSAREKHKTRWSVYALGEVLSVAGFLPIPLRHCDRDGRYNARDPVALADDYTGCLDPEMIRSTKYIRRLDTSLVMDGLKTR